jgi:hypothetical protein
VELIAAGQPLLRRLSSNISNQLASADAYIWPEHRRPVPTRPLRRQPMQAGRGSGGDTQSPTGAGSRSSPRKLQLHHRDFPRCRRKYAPRSRWHPGTSSGKPAWMMLNRPVRARAKSRKALNPRNQLSCAPAPSVAPLLPKGELELTDILRSTPCRQGLFPKFRRTGGPRGRRLQKMGRDLARPRRGRGETWANPRSVPETSAER